MMRRRRLLGLVGVGILRVTLATGAMAQDAVARPSIAIADVSVTPGGWMLPPPQLSSAIVELMMNELVTSQRFRVYDGQWLVPEAEIGHPDLERLRAAAADKHVDYVVIGSLTSFANEQKKKRIGGVLPTPLLIAGFSRSQAQLKVAMTFRIVDVRTGEIVSSVYGEGVGMRRSTAVGGVGLIHAFPIGAGGLASKMHPARDAMLDEAVRQAVHRAALALSQSTLPLPGR